MLKFLQRLYTSVLLVLQRKDILQEQKIIYQNIFFSGSLQFFAFEHYRNSFRVEFEGSSSSIGETCENLEEAVEKTTNNFCLFVRLCIITLVFLFFSFPVVIQVEIHVSNFSQHQSDNLFDS